MALQEEIDKQSAEVNTDGYPMSIGELMNLYDSKELDIHPEFQRFFRWSLSQKSRLIESILLGIPIPSIFVAQRKDGVWDVIDGLQRLSTIFQFAGILRDERRTLVEPLVLESTRYLPSLKNKTWETDDDNSTNALTPAQRLFIKRSKLDVKIILKTSSDTSKYELFQRLNTGGSELSDQEIRNCILISIDVDAYRWIERLAKEDHFLECLSISDRLLAEQYHLELALRFVILRNTANAALNTITDIGDFLTDRMTDAAAKRSLVRQEDERVFNETFRFLHNCSGPQTFQRYDHTDDRFKGPFLISAFEAVSMGVAHNLEAWLALEMPNDRFRAAIVRLWANPEFHTNIGSGVRASQRIPKIIPIAKETIKP